MSTIEFQRTDTTVNYHYKVTWKDRLGEEKTGDVFIHFKNGNFDSAHYPFQGTYTAEQWEVLGMIAKEIRLRTPPFSSPIMQDRAVCNDEMLF